MFHYSYKVLFSFLTDPRNNVKVNMYVFLVAGLECLLGYEYLDIHES